jgi:hypothetical protein
MFKPALALGALAFVSLPAFADGWKALPILNDPGYKMEPTLAVSLARVDPTDGGAVTAYGLDFNFNCLLLQDPQGRMRTHLNLSRSDEKGVDVTGYELSPRYTIPLEGGLSVGIGPSLAVFDVATARADKNLLGIGVAAGVNYRMGMLYLGADVRYHETGSRGGVDYDHFTIAAKVGVNF